MFHKATTLPEFYSSYFDGSIQDINYIRTSTPIRKTSGSGSVSNAIRLGSINQGINQSFDQSINQSINQSVDQSINQSPQFFTTSPRRRRPLIRAATMNDMSSSYSEDKTITDDSDSDSDTIDVESVRKGSEYGEGESESVIKMSESGIKMSESGIKMSESVRKRSESLLDEASRPQSSPLPMKELYTSCYGSLENDGGNWERNSLPIRKISTPVTITEMPRAQTALVLSSLSDHPMAATATYGKFGEYGQLGGSTRQIHTKRSVSASQPHSNQANALRLQQRRLHEQENIDQLLQKCRTSQRGIACNSQSMRYAEAGQRALYHTLGSNPHPGPQLALSDDGETLCVRNGAARSSLRIPAKQDHQVQAGPGLSGVAGYHSLDRKAHLMTYYRPVDENPYRLTALGHDPSAATLAMVSPRHGPTAHYLSLAHQPVSDQLQPNRHSVTGNAMSARKSQGENIYANFLHRDANLQLHKLSDDRTGASSQMKSSRYAESGYLSATTKTSPSGSGDANGSQLSLASSSGSVYSSVEEKYEAEIRKLNREMESYRQTISKLTAKHDGYNHLIQTFDSKLHLMAKHVENLQNKSQLKKDEVVKLRSEIDHLRVMSINAGVNVSPISVSNGQRKSAVSPQTQQEGAGELLRHNSLESVASHRSSLSSSSKGSSSKTDKSSLSSFGKQGKRSWIRSSFSKAFKGKKGKNGSVSDAEHSPMHTSASPSNLKPISGSASRLDEIESVPQVVELRRQLEDKDSALTDVRLDALDKAREVDILKETINRLKSENKLLKQSYTMLERRMRSESRASSQQSLSAMPDDDPVYEVPPASESSFSASNRSSGCITLRVTVSVELSGTLRPSSSSNEISIGLITLPTHQTSWHELDSHLYRLFKEYMERIDPCGSLGLHCKESMIGYEFGDFVRDFETGASPSPLPADVITQNTPIRIYLRGVTQRSLDGLILDCLFPRSMLEQLLKVLIQSRRLVLFGATGIGKSNLARQIAKYISIKLGGTTDCVVDLKIGEEDTDRNMAQVQKDLESLLRSSKPSVILIDNVQRHRISLLSTSFGSVETPAKEGPYVICTVNRASQLPEMQVHHNFRMFLLPNNVDSIRGYMGRFLRRRILESEFRDDERAPAEIHSIIEFLPKVLASVNSFIEKSNSRDVTIGPRLFLQCPLHVEKSREWFIKLWNQMIIPYMVKVAKEGVKVLGRCGSFEDPTDLVCEQWPWLEGPTAEEVLQRLSIKESIANPSTNHANFDPLEALIRIQSNNSNAAQQEVV